MDFQARFAAKLGLRTEGFGKLFEFLEAATSTKSTLSIVETGCIRLRDNWTGDGYSSFLFGTFAKEHEATFFSIDIDAGHCALAREVCPAGIFLCGDSVQVLYDLRDSVQSIDLLYLDSVDLDWQNPHPSALHHLKELCAAAPMLMKGSVVCVDDNDGLTGKGMYIRDYMKNIGAEQFFDGYQIAFRMP